MHSLEPEVNAAYARGAIPKDAAARALALESGAIFPLYEELRFAIYASVAAIAAGIGLLLKSHFTEIGPLTLIGLLGLAACPCYAVALRRLRRGEPRSLGEDYVLLLGTLIVSAAVGYAAYVFHLFGTGWPRHLLLLAGLHAGVAYVFGSRLVLAVAVAALAGYCGIEGRIGSPLDPEKLLAYSGYRALGCAALLMLWHLVHRRTGRLREFLEVFEHFAINLAFWGALSLAFQPDTRVTGVLVVAALVAYVLYVGRATAREGLIVYGIGYGALGACVLEAQLLRDGLLIAMAMLATVGAAAIALWIIHEQSRPKP